MLVLIHEGNCVLVRLAVVAVQRLRNASAVDRNDCENRYVQSQYEQKRRSTVRTRSMVSESCILSCCSA